MNNDSKLIFEAYQQGKGKKKLEKVDPANPANAIEQHADLMSDADREKFISGGHDLNAIKKPKDTKLAPLHVTSLGDLQYKASKDPRYAKLAMIAAANLGGSPKDLNSAMRWLELNASEGGTEEGVVDEINFCKDLVKEAAENPSPTSTTKQIEQEIYALLQKNSIQTSRFHVGDEDCWLAVSSITDRADLKRAQDLVKQYEAAFHKEFIVKPHLQPPV